MRSRLHAVIAAAVLVSSAAAQSRDKPDPQSAIEPRSGPGAGQNFLAKFVGDWDVAKTFYPRSGEPAKVTGTCRQTMIHAGRFLQSEFVFGRGDAKTTGLGVIGFDPATGLFTSVWTDSRQTRMSFRQGREKFDGKRILLYSEALGGDSGGRRSKTITELSDDGNKIVHRQYNLAGDGPERLVMELVLTRKVPR